MKVIYWTVTYSHRHGIDAWPVFSHQCADSKRGPTEDEVIADLGDLWEPDREDEFIEILQRQEIDIPLPDSPREDLTVAMCHQIDTETAERFDESSRVTACLESARIMACLIEQTAEQIMTPAQYKAFQHVIDEAHKMERAVELLKENVALIEGTNDARGEDTAELEFWQKTAIALWAEAHDDIDEHLSQTQIARLDAALRQHGDKEDS